MRSAPVASPRTLVRDWSVAHFHRRRRHELLRRALARIGIVASIAAALVFLARLAVALT